jgi:hypothetical protein
MKGDLNMRNYDRMVKRRKLFTSVWDETERKRDDLERQAGIENTNELRAKGRTQKIRDLYFSVSDPVIRRALMILERKEHDVMVEFRNRGVEEAEVIVEKAQARIDIPFHVWLTAAICGFMIVAAGQVVAGLTGAIGGAVAGYFIGQGIVAKCRGWARRALETARRDLDDERVDAAKSTAASPMFSSDEEISGVPDNGSMAARRPSDIDDNVFSQAFANMDELAADRAVREAGRILPPKPIGRRIASFLTRRTGSL